MSFRFVQFWFMSSFLNFRPNGCHYKLGQWVFHFTFGNSPNSSFVKSGKIGKKHPKRRSYENHLITIGNGEMIVWTLSTIYFTLLFRIDTFDLIRGSSLNNFRSSSYDRLLPCLPLKWNTYDRPLWIACFPEILRYPIVWIFVRSDLV